MKSILVDTNFLLVPYECKIDIVAELLRVIHSPFALLVASGTIDELKSIAGRTGKRAAAARFFLQNIEKYKKQINIKTIKSSGKVDMWIIKYAQEKNLCVATNDIPLRRKLLALGVPVIAVKGKSKLDFV